MRISARVAARSYGPDHMHLVVARGYLGRLLGNARGAGAGLEAVTDLGRIVTRKRSNNGCLARARLAKQPDNRGVAARRLAHRLSFVALLAEQLRRNRVPTPLEHIP